MAACCIIVFLCSKARPRPSFLVRKNFALLTVSTKAIPLATHTGKFRGVLSDNRIGPSSEANMFGDESSVRDPVSMQRFILKAMASGPRKTPPKGISESNLSVLFSSKYSSSSAGNSVSEALIARILER